MEIEIEISCKNPIRISYPYDGRMVFVPRICRDDKKKWRDYISIAKRTKRTKWRIVSLVVEQFYDRVPGLKR